MISRKICHVSLFWSLQRNNTINLKTCGRSASVLCNHLDISESKAEYISLKHPVVRKLTNGKIQELIDTLFQLGYSRETLVEEPVLFAMLPITLKYRHQVLTECAFENITPRHLVTYLPLVKQKTIGQLKKTGDILSTVNIENRLATYMTQWPTSLTTLVYGDVNDCTLHNLRLKIIQRYLELVLDLRNEEFYRGLETYPTMKHRPLAVINETLTILQSQIMMPIHKIKSNLYLIHVDPDNLKLILYNFKAIGGIDIKEVIRMYPKIASKNYYTLCEMRKVLEDFGINNEAQTRCFEIYTLGPDTVRERLKRAMKIPEFNAFFNHPRFLKMIYHNTTAVKRLTKSYEINKKCLSLNVLSGSTAHYESFEKAPGDRLGKGRDLIFCISQSLGKTYHKNSIRESVKRHPFWINIPLVQVKYVYEKLSSDFTAEDIFKNCPILLYPWSKITELLQLVKKNQTKKLFPIHYEHLDLSKLDKTQKLSLILYLLEKNHYFTGNGVWTEEKTKTNTDFLNSDMNMIESEYPIKV